MKKTRSLLLILVTSFLLSACANFNLGIKTRGIPVEYRNVMLEALTQRDWLSVNEFGLATLHSFRVNDHGVIIKYIQFPQQSLSVIEAQKILTVDEVNSGDGDHGTSQTNQSSGDANQLTYRKSAEYYVKEVPDGYQLDLNKTAYVRFALSPENRLIRIIRLSWQEAHVYSMTPLDKLQEYDDGVF